VTDAYFGNRQSRGSDFRLFRSHGQQLFLDVVRVIDGTSINGHFWFFYGALSNVEYTITVTDAARGETARYENASGRFASVGDTAAF